LLQRILFWKRRHLKINEMRRVRNKSSETQAYKSAIKTRDNNISYFQKLNTKNITERAAE
jgi:hypothetical protein